MSTQTQNETARALRDEFYKKGGLKDQLIFDMKKTLRADMFTWLGGGGALLIFAIIAAYFSLENRVSSVENTLSIGGRWTAEQQEIFSQSIQGDINEVKEDVKWIRDHMVRLN